MGEREGQACPVLNQGTGTGLSRPHRRAQVAALAGSEEWIADLRFVAAFRRYSFRNVVLIAAQCPHVTYVAGYRTWQDLGRQVGKGERTIKILGYSTKKVTGTDPDTGEEVEDRLVRYPVLSVFDISQTDGKPVPADPYQLPTEHGPDVALDRLTGWLTSEGWTLRELPLAGTCEGYTDHERRLIATDTRLEPAARLVVLLHEAAHAVLHRDLNSGEYYQHRRVCETEAESCGAQELQPGSLGRWSSGVTVFVDQSTK
jgi:hypothetical protein